MNRNTRISRNRNKNKNKRNRSLGKQSKNRKRSSRNRRQRLSRNRRRQRSSRNRRQRGGFFTTSVAPVQENPVTTSTIADVSTGQDCNLRNDASIFQSTFENATNDVAPNLDNYLLVNNDVFVSPQ